MLWSEWLSAKGLQRVSEDLEADFTLYINNSMNLNTKIEMKKKKKEEEFIQDLMIGKNFTIIKKEIFCK